jgi:hypothetical protein
MQADGGRADDREVLGGGLAVALPISALLWGAAVAVALVVG